MKLKSIVNILILCFVLSCTIGAAMAEEVGNPQVIPANTSEHVSNDDSNSVSSDGELSPDEIYSDDYVLGFKKGNGEFKDVANVKESMRTWSAFDYVWAFVKLLFAILIGAVIFGVPLAILYILIKVIIAIREDNPSTSINKMLGERNRGTALIVGGGILLGYLAVFGFAISLLS